MSATRTDKRGGQNRAKTKARGKATAPPAATGREARQAARQAALEDVERRLFRKITAWARLWECCPVNACQRAGVCRREDDCRAIDRTKPAPDFTERDLRHFRALFRKESARRAALARG